MNIYIEVEIRPRELERALLLGSLAAAGGHRVLLGRLKGRISSGKIPVKPGVYHAKAIGPDLATHRLLDGLQARGFLVTSQDEEHGLAASDYQPFAKIRFSSTTISRVERVFFWGSHDHDAVAAAHPALRSRMMKTGSPRVDLWRPDQSEYYSNYRLAGVDPSRLLILFVSNVGGPIGVNGLATSIRDRRSSDRRVDGPAVRGVIEGYAYKSSVLAGLVEAIHHLASRMREAQIVVRPHPVEQWGAWNDLVGLHDNVLVTRQHSIGPWIRAANAVIQNGCTSAFEAAVAQRPLISYLPNGLGADLPPNHLGLRIGDLDELEAAIGQAIAGRLPVAGRKPEERRILNHRFASLEGPLAAQRIVDAWEELDGPGLDRPWNSRFVQVLADSWAVRNRVIHHRDRPDSRGVASPYKTSWSETHGELSQIPFVTGQKFPPLHQHEVDDILRRLGLIGIPTDRVHARRLGPDMVRIDPQN